MVPDRAFFATQWQSAERWAAGLDRAFDPERPEWRRLLAEVQAGPDPDAAARRLRCRMLSSAPILLGAIAADPMET